jgi:hypothetical protein
VPGNIFISYRRDDSAGHAGRVHDRLTNEFGEGLIFMDVDSIPLGSDFVKFIKKEVASCDVLLAIIGPKWAHAQDRVGGTRLNDPSDFVRIEIAAALERDIPVIPVLLDEAPMPTADILPSDLHSLLLRNGIRVRHESFKADIQKLVTFLHEHFKASSGEPEDVLHPDPVSVSANNQEPSNISRSLLKAIAMDLSSLLYRRFNKPTRS